jgi:hypothetical protein
MITPRLCPRTRGPRLAAALLLLTGYASAQPPPFTLTILYCCLEDAQGVTVGSGGVLYGTDRGTGQVFSLAPPTSPGAAWTPTTLYTFNFPQPGPAIGSGGELYGATARHSACAGGQRLDCSLVYSLAPPTSPGGTWTETAIYRFLAGSIPLGVVIGAGGVLYGSTYETLFSLSPPASPGSSWTFTQLYAFAGGSEGNDAGGGLVIGRGGALFGTTSDGGVGYGTVFALTPPAAPGDAWTHSVLYRFAGGSSGTGPSGVTIGKDGVLYGTLSGGGNTACSVGCGTVFAQAPPSTPGGAWVFTTLYSFTGGDDGYDPNPGVAIGKNGELFGTTYGGGPGAYGPGTVFALTPPSSAGGTWTKTTVYSFTGYPNGGVPVYSLVFGADGVLYGTVDEDVGIQLMGGVFSLTTE